MMCQLKKPEEALVGVRNNLQRLVALRDELAKGGASGKGTLGKGTQNEQIRALTTLLNSTVENVDLMADRLTDATAKISDVESVLTEPQRVLLSEKAEKRVLLKIESFCKSDNGGLKIMKKLVPRRLAAIAAAQPPSAITAAQPPSAITAAQPPSSTNLALSNPAANLGRPQRGPVKRIALAESARALMPESARALMPRPSTRRQSSERASPPGQAEVEHSDPHYA